MVCQRCQGPLLVASQKLHGCAVYRCTLCAAMGVEGSPHWPTPGSEQQKWIEVLAKEVGQERRRFEEIVDSDLSDPRWS
jgi:hypothetical protein